MCQFKYSSMMRMALAAAVVLAAAAYVTARPGDAGKTPVLADFSWFAGHWRLTDGGKTVEEVWLPSRGGLLLGMNRTTSQRGAAFEFLRIEERAGKIAYIASPGGGEGTIFPLASLTGQTALFENPSHDFPKRIRYERKGETLIATISGDAGATQTWSWKLVQKLQ